MFCRAGKKFCRELLLVMWIFITLHIKFLIATTTAPTQPPTTSPTTSEQTTSSPVMPSAQGCTGGCIAGIIVGFLIVLVLVVVIIVIVLCYWSKTRSKWFFSVLRFHSRIQIYSESGGMKVSHEMEEQSDKLTWATCSTHWAVYFVNRVLVGTCVYIISIVNTSWLLLSMPPPQSQPWRSCGPHIWFSPHWNLQGQSVRGRSNIAPSVQYVTR